MVVFGLRTDHSCKDFVLSDDCDISLLPDFEGEPIESLPDLTIMADPDTPPAPFPDFTGLYFSANCVFSQRAVTRLGALLETHGQLFPVRCDVGEYFLYNVTTVVDALDREHSAMDMWPHLKREREAGIPQGVRGVKQYWFHADRLEGVDIFKLPEFPLTEVYVSDRFVGAAEQAGLTGFRFERLWSPEDPMPDLRPRRLPG